MSFKAYFTSENSKRENCQSDDEEPPLLIVAIVSHELHGFFDGEFSGDGGDVSGHGRR